MKSTKKLVYKFYLQEGLCRNGDVGDQKRNKDRSTSIIASDIGNPWFSRLILLHEFLENLLCEFNGISEEELDAFDKWFEAEKAAGRIPKNASAGYHPKAPYGPFHRFIEAGPELLTCKELGFTWKQYDRAILRFMKKMESPKVKGMKTQQFTNRARRD